MAREKECYRDNLELIMQAYPDKTLLNISEVGNYLGIARQTASKMFDYKTIGKSKYISIANLARALS